MTFIFKSVNSFSITDLHFLTHNPSREFGYELSTHAARCLGKIYLTFLLKVTNCVYAIFRLNSVFTSSRRGLVTYYFNPLDEIDVVVPADLHVRHPGLRHQLPPAVQPRREVLQPGRLLPRHLRHDDWGVRVQGPLHRCKKI